MALSDGLLDNAHCFYIHNWYKFIEICDILKTRSTDAVSTLRCKRKGLLDGVTKKKLRTDEQIVMYEHYLAFAVTHWKDKRDVFMLATCMREWESVARRRRKEAHIKNVFHSYNQLMDGIYRGKQMTTSYPTEHTRVKKRYKKQFLCLINISINISINIFQCTY